MNQTISVVAALMFATFCGVAHSQNAISDLESEIESGRISLEAIHGNGSSSGMAIEAVIRNTTGKPLRLNTNLRRPIYLGNRSSRSSQNMIAFSVYGRGGSYYSDGDNAFIEVAPNKEMDIEMIAYCADYDKDNPSSADQFDISRMPPQIERASEKIAAYKRNNPDVDVLKAAQVALWLAQGVSAEKIQTTFPFSPNEEAVAREILEP